ncbi:MAG: acyl-CoA/acyl-ACP dehydrogenase [Actinomycetia bacterium]|nr:acyl-CoA/acyl-ACP dehydrogenase [Actinomycetes bacterium]MCP5034285.1 acyl-CoA/acyl-ACP dehydrogenase [Actinomycetes bacterium]
MDTDATDDQQALLDVSAQFMEDTCPLTLIRDSDQRDAAFNEAYRRQGAELGWYSMLVPEGLGGGCISDNGLLDATLIAYKRGGLLQPGSFVGTNVTAHALAEAGSDELRQKVLPGLVNGDVSASWAVAGSDSQRLDSGVEAKPTDDGGLTLSGVKIAVQDVEPSSWLLVTGQSPNGAAQALVAADAAGVVVTPLDSLDLSRRFAEVTFDGVQVPPSAVVGTPGAIDDLLDRQLAIAATLTAAEAVGAMDYEFEMTVQYAKDRIAFGRPIGSFQAVKHLLADTSLAVEIGKAVVLAAARSLGSGDDHGPQAASMAKAMVGDAAIDLAQNCFQVFGGIGYTWEHDQHLYLRRLTTDSGLYGDASWHREHLCQLAGI